MNKRFDIRFCVNNNKGGRSSIWRLWTLRNDVYLSVRSLGGIFKASLHESGQWQCSFSSTYIANTGTPNKVRHIDQWQRPEEIYPGLTLAFRVIILTSELRNYAMTVGSTKKIYWIPCDSNNPITEIDIIFTKQSLKVSSWPGENSMNTFLIDKFKLLNNQTLWIVYRYQLLSAQDIENLKNYKKIMKSAALMVVQNKDNIQALLGSSEADGSRKFIEIAVD